MSYPNRVYRVVDISGQSGQVLQTKFDSVKSAGVIETDLSTCRKSLDGTKMILKYVGNSAGESINSQWPPPKVLFSGTHSEMIQFLLDNAGEWIDDTHPV